MRISDWSSDVCSSDLDSAKPLQATDEAAAWSRRCARPARMRNRPPPANSIAEQKRAKRNGSAMPTAAARDRKSVEKGKRVYVPVDHGGRRHIKQKRKKTRTAKIGMGKRCNIHL